jgi:formylglycine-generating enzyme required for sulfatase activity
MRVSLITVSVLFLAVPAAAVLAQGNMTQRPGDSSAPSPGTHAALGAAAPAVPASRERAKTPAPSAGEERSFPPSNAEYAFVPAGTFEMGCVPRDRRCATVESPRHPVTISRGFWMATTLTTVAQYRAYALATGRATPPAPSFAQGDDDPVVQVTWDGAAAYCSWAGGRLPTEAEWEYAARGGKDGTVYPWGDAVSRDRMNFFGTGGRDRWDHTSPVGSFEANGFGLFDMAGNVWEWCADWYAEDVYGGGATRDPRGPASGDSRVLRGGSWQLDSRNARSSNRMGGIPSDGDDSVGFRCVRDVTAP